MPAQREPTKLASDGVHRQLRREILQGELAPGDAVPSERILSERLGVNRHAIREALKRLQQAGLVRISQGGATRVLDWREAGGLEVLLDLMDEPGEPPAELIRSVIEMRETIGIDAARKCVERAGAETLSRARELATASADAIAAEQGEEAMGRFVELWETVVDGSGNVAYRLAINSLNRALDAYPDLAVALMPTEPGDLRDLSTAFADADPTAAAGAAARLLGSAARP